MRLNNSQAPVVAKLNSFADLPAGWCYGAGAPISKYVLARGRDIIGEYLANGFTKLDAIPVATGEVQLLAYKDAHRLSLIVSETAAEFSHEEGEDVVSEVDEITAVRVGHHIRKAAEYVWGTSVSSTRKTMRSIVPDSATSAFVSLRMAGSLCSTPTARLPLAV